MLILFFTFLKIGIFTLGSGYSMLVLAKRYVVEQYQWLSVAEFADVVAMAEMTPGPIMINLATFVGTRVAGFKGAVFATAGLVFIPFVCIYVLALHYDTWRNLALAQRVMRAVRPLAIGFIAVALIELARISVADVKSALVVAAVIVLTLFGKVNPIYTLLAGIAVSALWR